MKHYIRMSGFILDSEYFTEPFLFSGGKNDGRYNNNERESSDDWTDHNSCDISWKAELYLNQRS